MSEEDAEKIAWVLASADNGCSTCVGELCARMKVKFPGQDWVGLTEKYAEEWA